MKSVQGPHWILEPSRGRTEPDAVAAAALRGRRVDNFIFAGRKGGK